MWIEKSEMLASKLQQHVVMLDTCRILSEPQLSPHASRPRSRPISVRHQ